MSRIATRQGNDAALFVLPNHQCEKSKQGNESKFYP